MIAFSFLNLRNIWERSKNKYILGNLSRFRLCHGTKWLSCQHFNRKSHIMNISLVSKMKHVAKNNVILKIQDMNKKRRKYNGCVTFRLYFKIVNNNMSRSIYIQTSDDIVDTIEKERNELTVMFRKDWKTLSIEYDEGRKSLEDFLRSAGRNIRVGHNFKLSVNTSRKRF